jgi:hypothetical protein
LLLISAYSGVILLLGNSFQRLFHRRAFKTAGETEKYFMVFLLLLTSALDPERPRPLPLRLMGTFYIFSFHIIFHHRARVREENTVLFHEPLHIFG